MDYIATPGKFLVELRNMIGEKAVLSFPVAESIWTMPRKVRYWLRGCPLFFYRYNSLKALLTRAGFSHFTIERIQRDYFVVVKPS